MMEEMKKIKLGTIGSGSIVRSILDAVSVTEGISLEAVYSRSHEKGSDLAKKYGCLKVYTDMEELLSDGEVNTVYIASPNSLHYEQIKRALARGKHVICEKPFCARAGEVREVISMAKERRLFLVDAVPTAFLPNFRLVQEQLPNIGRVKLVNCNYSQYSSRYDQLLAGEMTNVFDPAFAGGCIQDINFYNIYFTVALFGKPDIVKYFANVHPMSVDTSGVAILQYDGFVSVCVGAKDAHGFNSAQIEGEDGFLYIRGGSNGIAELRVVTKTSDRSFNLQTNPDRLFYEIQGLVPFLLADDYEAVYTRLDTTLDVISVIEAARRDAGILFEGD